MEWLAVGAGPILVLVSLYLVFSRRLHRNRQELLDNVGQLGSRLHRQLSLQQSESNQKHSHVTSRIIEVLRDSEELLDSSESIHLASVVSSVHPVRESIAILSRRIREMEEQHPSQRDPQSLNLACLAVIYVRSHIGDVIRVEHMAEELGVSKSKLYLHLKKSLNCSAHELITLIKMQEAKRLLKTGDFLVKEVAYKLGFWSPYHFSRNFKSFFGQSPNDYKELYQHHWHPVAKAASGNREIAGANNPRLNNDEGIKKSKARDIKILPSGTAIGRFLIVNPIGHGGMGVVYKAYDPKLNRGVALKLIRTGFEKSIQSQSRLLREAQALARLSHPNVLHVYDVGTYDDQVFMTMALVEGQTLGEWLKTQKHSVEDILKVLIAAGRGLAAAHKAGLVHRDFKPGNVILGKDGQVRVLDFGLARAVSTREDEEGSDSQPIDSESIKAINKISSGDISNMLLTPLTHAGNIVGTPMYMAPEQHLGIETDERTDQFGFCVVLYEALYGRRPFAARSIEDLKSEVIRQQVIVPPADSDVPAWLWQIIRRGLSSKSEDRYPTLDLLLEDLDRESQEPHRQKQLARRLKLFVVLLVLLAIALPVTVWNAMRNREVQLCKEVDSELDGIWDDPLKDTIRRAFLATKKPYAQWTWKSVERTFDIYLDEWTQLRSDVCEAKFLRKTLSEERFDLQMSCLKKRLREIKALTIIFAAADYNVVQGAIQATTSLNPIAICTDEKAMRSPYPPPKTAEVKAKVAAIREDFRKVEAFNKTGMFQDGLNLAKKLVKKANAIDYLPVQAEATYWLGYFWDRTGEYKKAESTLRDAARMAGKSINSLLAGKALVLLVPLLGYIQRRHNEAFSLGNAAEILLDVAGGDERTRSQLLNDMGVVFWSNNEYDKALEFLGNALAIRKKSQGQEHPSIASTLINIGIVLENKGENAQALVHFKKALKIQRKVFGPRHPHVATTLYNLGELLKNKGEYDQALEYLRKALAIRQESLGFEHPRVALSLMAVGGVFLEKGMPRQALEVLGQAVSLCERKSCQPEAKGLSHFYLARALVATDGDKEHAAKLAKQAFDIFDKTPKAFRKEIEEVNAWLKTHALGTRRSHHKGR